MAPVLALSLIAARWGVHESRWSAEHICQGVAAMQLPAEPPCSTMVTRRTLPHQQQTCSACIAKASQVLLHLGHRLEDQGIMYRMCLNTEAGRRCGSHLQRLEIDHMSSMRGG